MRRRLAIIRNIVITLLMAAAFLVVLLLTLPFSGCTKLIIPVSGGKEIVYEKGWIEASAEKVDFYYEDPNITVWIIVNDPCSSVNPGRLSVVEPYTGIKAEVEAK